MKIWVSLFTLLQIVINGQLPEKKLTIRDPPFKDTQSHCQFSLSSSRSRAFSCRVISLGNGVFTPGVIRARLRQTRNAQYMLIQCFTVRHSFRPWWFSDLGGTTALRLPLERCTEVGDRRRDPVSVEFWNWPLVEWLPLLCRVSGDRSTAAARCDYTSADVPYSGDRQRPCGVIDLLWTSSPARRCVWKRSLLL